MDEKLMRVVSDFITQRVNGLGTDAPDKVTEAISEVENRVRQLEDALTPEQAPLLRELENALSLQVGEGVRYYYRAGFYDAVRFLMD